MQMNVEIGGRANRLPERDGAAVGLAAFESRLFDQKCRNDLVGDLQDWREQLGMGGEEVT
jgi:hypothetical protein